MSSVAERPETARAGGLPAVLARARWRLGLGGLELALYGAITLLAGALRFWDLGSRAMHHDESLHAQFSWYFYQGILDAAAAFLDGPADLTFYHHDPLMHGTFLFHITAFTFLIFGDSDFTARIPPALFGTALVVMPLLFRGRLGRVGALTASALLALSPTLLYFSRFQRNDLYIAVFTLAMVIAIWRYLDGGSRRWLYALAGALALSFTSKETTYIAVAIFLVAVDFMTTADLVNQIGSARAWLSARRAAAFVALAPVAWLAVAVWPLLERPRDRWGLGPMPRSGHVLLVLGTLSLPLFAAGIQVPLEALGMELLQPVSVGPWLTDREHLVGWLTILTLLTGSATVGLAWSPRVWAIAFAAFIIPFVFFYTTMFTWVPEGIYSGFWRGLDYWLEQQEVQRGGQPVFYYLMLLPVYEFLPLVLGLGAGLIYIFRGGSAKSTVFLAVAAGYSALVLGGPLAGHPLVPTLALALATAYTLEADRFRQFLMFWFVASLFAYSVAGERMPWLLVHLALPLIILSAVAVNDLAGWLGRAAPRRPLIGPGLLAGAAALGALAAVLLIERRDGGPWLALHAGAVLGIAGIAVGLGRAVAPRWVAGVLVAGLVGLLAVFSVRAAYMASFQHGDVPVEMLVYTQTSPELVEIRDRIDEVAERTGQGESLGITVDATDSFSWPWAWYLRDYNNTGYPTVRDGPAPSYTPVMIMNASNASKVAEHGQLFAEGERFPHRQWFPEDYKRMSREDFLIGLFEGSRWRTWWDYWMWRKTPSPIGHVDAVAFFPAGAVGDGAIGDGPLEPREEDGSLIIGGLGVAPGAFNRPADVAIGPDGSIYVADTGNHRIQRFDAGGRFVAEAGAPGSGEGQFSEPWGIAVGPDGTVYVADTWNHRIQKLDGDLRPVASWGQAVSDLESPGPFELYGPRDIAFDGDGNLLVADTGNKRVVRYSPDGDYLGEFGGPGDGPGQFNEPVGLAVTPDGGILVADTWNGRVQRFDPSFSFVAEYPVEGWDSTDRLDKPYLAALPDGRMVLSVPAEGALRLLDQSGETAAVLTGPPGGGEAFAHPVGVAVDRQGHVYVVELGASRLRRFSLQP